MPSSKKSVDPKVKDVLRILGAGAFLTASIIIPGLPKLAKPYLASRKNHETLEWKKYNQWRLRQVLKRLYKQKMVEVGEENGMQVVKITENGRRKLLRYTLENLELNKRKWDGKWRIVIYDIYTKKRSERNLFHSMLKRLEFLQLQKSVYLTPYPCHDEIEYLRQVCGIGSEVFILVITGLENETAYKEYFCLK